MVNKVILMGYVGKDPDIRRMDNNLVKAQFSIATNERWVKDGNKVEHTEWHNVVMWRSLAEIAEKYVRKGSLIYVEGRINSRSYDDKDGIKRYAIDIVADTMQLVGPKQDAQSVLNSPSAEQQPKGLPPVETTDLGADAPDDLPF